MAFAAAAVAGMAHALPPVCPRLPPVAYADTETVTNVPFAAWEKGLREFRFDLEFTGTASNCVEMAFGTDADGDGELSDGEADLLAGWDCGELFVADNATDVRHSEARPSGAHSFSCVCAMRPGGKMARVSFTDNAEAAFAGLAAAQPAWMHSPSWNMVRLVGRGENVRTGERFSAKTTPAGFLLRLR